MSPVRRAQPIACAFCFLLATIPLDAQTIDEIVVTADLRERTITDLPASVSVLDGAMIRGAAEQHFEELINLVPNLNWSGDGHRARYFQIRGVGELEQYQGAPNPSVGLLIDDMDFSGIGTIATLFDLDRIEVLRGPQGTRYGANALGGLISMRSASPTPDWDGKVRVSRGGDNAFSGGLAFGGPVANSDVLRFRASLHRHRSNGFRSNEFLGRDDTNGRDETTVRGKLLWEPGDEWRVEAAVLYADVDDGYDAFSLDNSYRMLSDKPGRDSQRSVGVSLRTAYVSAGGFEVTSITAAAESDIAFGFDADWGNAESWAPVTYDYVSDSARTRATLSQEVRVARDNWLAGAYLLRLEEDLNTVNRGEYYDPGYDFADSLDEFFAGEYSATNLALFGEYDREFGSGIGLSGGVRVERRRTRYGDTDGLRADPSETMSGGELGLRYGIADAFSIYARLAKGYKAGGFNLGAVPDERREFSAETLWSFELGVKGVFRDNTLSMTATVFANRHRDQQVRTSFQLVPGDPASFVFFTDNAARGKAKGLETELRWDPVPAWSLYANLGLLDAEFDRFVTPQVNLSGRDQAHAPRVTAAAGISYRSQGGFLARIDASTMDSFYFDVSHDERSKAYDIANLRLGYEWREWTAQVWLRNAFDERYAVRGFYFGNEPPDFPPKLYVRLGDPRQAGLTIERRF